LINKVTSKLAADVAQTAIELLKPFKDHVHTITADNDRTFAYHAKLAEALATKVYLLILIALGSQVPTKIAI
jgi:IS30 family transposase